MATITQKQGDSLEWVTTITNRGETLDITGWSIRAQIRNNDTLIATLTVTITSAVAGVFSVTATPAETDAWTAGTHKCDIEFTDASGDVFSTESFTMTVVEDITHD